MWVHQYQYVEVTDPLFPRLHGKALPIVRYEMNSDNTIILGVQAGLGNNMSKWFKRNQFMLYKTSKDIIKLTHENNHTEGRISKFLKSMGLKHFNKG